MIGQRTILVAVIVTAAFVSADLSHDAPDAVVPEIDEVTPISMTQARPRSKAVGGSVPYGPSMVDGKIDDDADYHAEDVNRDGWNKLVGPGKTSDMGAKHVKPPGYTTHDAIDMGKQGYFLGPSRRRIGAGFGRRRRSKPVKISNAAKKTVAQLQGKKFVKPKKPTKKETKKKKVPEALKPINEQIKDEEKAGIKIHITKHAEVKDLKVDKVTKSGNAAVDRMMKPKSKDIPPKLEIRVTTGKEKNAESGQSPTVKVVGEGGKFFEGKISTAGEGKSKITTFKLKHDLGKITSVSLKASSTDGWLLTKFEVKSGVLAWQSFGCLPRWLDGKPYDKSPYDHPHGDKFTLKPGTCKTTMPKLEIRVTTSKEKNAETGNWPTVKVTGAGGKTFEGKVVTAGKGKTKTTSFTPPYDLGKITSVSLKATGTDGWLLTKFEVKSGALKWQPFGCLPRWLDGKPYDTSPYDHPHGDQFALQPGSCETHMPKLEIRVTTGKERYAESGQTPTIKAVGANGKTFEGKISTAAEGHSKTTSFKLKHDLGKITSVFIKASGSDGWLLTKFEAKSTGRKWQSFGCLPRWLDGKPYDSDPYTHPYGDKFTLKTGTCAPSYPASWGPKTLLGCFCKNSGKSGKCGKNGDKLKWCRTRDNCKGYHSVHGNWDRC
jgi:hypothetical protein